MTLSARIAVGPSLRVASLASVVATGGFVVAGVALAACRPGATAVVVVAAVAGWGLALAGIFHGYRATSRIVLSVSDRAEFGIDGHQQPWRLVEPTMRWPGFSVIAIAESGASASTGLLRYPLFGADIAPPDRRAFARFLLWSLRGGGTAGRP